MEVILMERIERLGQMGDVVRVKPGYARNFLLPQQKALRATKHNRERFERERTQLEARNLGERTEAEGVAAKLEGAMVTLIRQASDSGQLYGSVTARDIAISLTDEGFTVERRQVTLDRPIKALGLHAVRIVVHPEVIVTVTANVARTKDEARMQVQRGEAVTAAGLAAEDDAAAALATAEEALAMAREGEDAQGSADTAGDGGAESDERADTRANDGGRG